MKKQLLSFFIILLPFFCFSQEILSGIVRDKNTGAPLPFANILTNIGKGVITDADGKFQIDNSNGEVLSLTFSYIGYLEKTVKTDSEKNFYSITLDEKPEKLREVVVTGGQNPALEIIKKAMKKRAENDPEKVLNSFKFRTYNKLIVTANPDSINGTVDSLFKKTNRGKEFVKLDSTNYELKKQLSRSHLYMSEKISEYAYNKQKGRRETILATKMAGFKEPVYEMIALQMQSFSFYQNSYTILGTNYPNPIGSRAPGTYHYRILDTIPDQLNQRPAYMIYYYPKEKGKTAGIEGVLYIDSESYALQKAVAQLKAVIDISASQTFEYFPEKNIWFPSSKQIKITRGENNEGISLLGGSISFNGDEKKDKDSTSMTSSQQDVSKLMHFISREENFDISFNTPVEIKGRGIALDIDDNAHRQSEDFWNNYRRGPLSLRGKETYVVVDSISEANKVERKLNLARKLLKGYYPLKYVDLDLRYLLKYNNYEGFRLGIGAITNTDFSSKYRLRGYSVYGTKDKKIKFGMGAAARLAKMTNTWIGVSYMDDLIETGSAEFINEARSFSLFEPRLFNITMLHKTRKTSAYLEHDITAKIGAKLQVSQSNIVPTYDYRFVNNGTSYYDFKLTEATLALQWTPFSRYMQTRHGKATMKNEYPNLTFQVSRSFRNLLEGDFDFTKLDFRAMHLIKHPNRTSTSFLVKGGLAYGDIPITHLYHASPNQPEGHAILQRFSVAGRDSFETMYFNEFFSDRYAMFQLKHQSNRFKLIGKIRPEIVLISRFAIGSVTHTEKHIGQDFKSLNKGYLESGFELNKIFKGFGLSTMYRYGPYRLPHFDDNISFKFTYYLSLGF
ncbi:DUF5686 and carboxypeptidase-like regulatory domain-containing protein [Sinomicrobium weinanense]|uniref:Carboxypeptidase-like regulatory domain-containing protein n=1 Tax=Sinomicrobium weinanense TaxID=2842200 RepID=A0A926JNH9_9FLAO|nr:DUF5686 and carboxypeptidase-like regulatory domain-containing protein [Sinomicrobium weinanense]MBC9794540.1 carboxypeptidase-like regulatory domain-containing protein [Sinomicrobium weinanense]MBU3124447.1 DUF5686 and carboxypeptidase regulatory-like domain-containing protein [Sinomicrobium weinanense]